jgi:hypothetical protein
MKLSKQHQEANQVLPTLSDSRSRSSHRNPRLHTRRPRQSIRRRTHPARVALDQPEGQTFGRGSDEEEA